MDACTLSMSVAALANIIAVELSDEKLGQVAAIFSQLGDTLNTIQAQRELIATCKSKNTSSIGDSTNPSAGGGVKNEG